MNEMNEINSEIKPRVNKTAFVRNVLKEIGAINDNPPEDWKQKVQEALANENLSMNPVTIYQIRRSEIDRIEHGMPLRSKSIPKSKPKSRTSTDLTFADLKSVQEFAKNFVGGLDGLSNAISAIQSLKV